MMIFSEVMSQSSAALQLRYLQVIVLTITITITTLQIIAIITLKIIFIITLKFIIILMFSDVEQYQRGEKLNNHISSSHRPGQECCRVNNCYHLHHPRR